MDIVPNTTSRALLAPNLMHNPPHCRELMQIRCQKGTCTKVNKCSVVTMLVVQKFKKSYLPVEHAEELVLDLHEASQIQDEGEVQVEPGEGCGDDAHLVRL